MKKFLIALLLLTASFNVFAQDFAAELQPPTAEISGLPFDLLPPGARALGLGGAFVGVADDATASLANPAGLTNLTAPEFSLHGRDTDADFAFLDPDAYDSAALYEAGDLQKQYSDSTTDVSFASFVYPLDRWVFSGYYSNQIDFSSAQSQPDSRLDPVFLDEYTNFNSVSASLDSYGLSAAFRMTDSWSIGVSVQQSDLDLSSQDIWEINHFGDIEQLLAEGVGGIGGNGTAEQYRQVVRDNFTYDARVDASDDDVSFNVGLLYNPGGNWSFGLVYKDGPEFTMPTSGSIDAGAGCNATGADQLLQDCQALFAALGPDFVAETWMDQSVSGTTKVAVPDILSLGIAWRPTQTLLLSLDVNQIYYSDLNPPRMVTQGFGTNINDQSQRTNFQGSGFPMNDPNIANLQGPITEPIDDEVSFNFGIENVFTFGGNVLRTFTVRGGAFTIEDHDGIVALDTDETVLTLGLGATFGRQGIGEKVFQVDLGASFADDVDTVILSGIFRF
ncbi:MAG TPA: outer membrane protein transport protein [Xanthomonadales bacterium]|nr:outer membrane protein transport protein [Xanthomonadales bacterium]